MWTRAHHLDWTHPRSMQRNSTCTIVPTRRVFKKKLAIMESMAIWITGEHPTKMRTQRAAVRATTADTTVEATQTSVRKDSNSILQLDSSHPQLSLTWKATCMSIQKCIRLQLPLLSNQAAQETNPHHRHLDWLTRKTWDRTIMHRLQMCLSRLRIALWRSRHLQEPMLEAIQDQATPQETVSFSARRSQHSTSVRPQLTADQARQANQKQIEPQRTPSQRLSKQVALQCHGQKSRPRSSTLQIQISTLPSHMAPMHSTIQTPQQLTSQWQLARATASWLEAHARPSEIKKTHILALQIQITQGLLCLSRNLHISKGHRRLVMAHQRLR